MCNCNKGSSSTPRNVAFKKPPVVNQAGVPVVTRATRAPPPRPVRSFAGRPVVPSR